MGVRNRLESLGFVSPKIFISYRRSDAGGYAGRLVDALSGYYGDRALFLDHDAIRGGDRFAEALEDAVSEAEVVLVVIGPDWLDVEQGGKRRLDDPEDWVRREVATALDRRGVRVIPVLVGGAELPTAEDLPDPLRPLVSRQVHTLRPDRFDDDVAHLRKSIGGWRRRWLGVPAYLWGLGAVATFAAALLAVFWLRGDVNLPPTIRVPGAVSAVSGDDIEIDILEWATDDSSSDLQLIVDPASENDGTVTDLEDGRVVYSAARGFQGTDRFGNPTGLTTESTESAAQSTTTKQAAVNATTPTTTATTSPTETTVTDAATTQTTVTDTTDPDAFVPAAVAAGAFTFLAGTSPRLAVLVSLATAGPGGPWEDAGDAPGPAVAAGSDFWLRFEVQNRSSNATMTDPDLSVPGFGDVCPDFAGLGPLGTLECVVGPFVAEAGEREIEFDVDARGFRQGIDDESIIDPPLSKTHPFAGAPHSFTLLFAVDLASLNGALLEGAVTEPTITIEPPALGFANPVAVDCSDRFPGGFSETGGSPQPGEPPLFAYAITVFNPDGSVADTCSQIPEFESTFKLADDSDITIHYVGA